MNSADSIIDGLGGEVKPGKCRCPACGGKTLSVEQNSGLRRSQMWELRGKKT